MNKKYSGFHENANDVFYLIMLNINNLRFDCSGRHGACLYTTFHENYGFPDTSYFVGRIG